MVFGYKHKYLNCSIFSDRPIDSSINKVLAASLKKVKKSDIYDSTTHFKIFLCNDLWRFSLFTFGKKNAGAITHSHTTGNIFIRPNDIEKNIIIAPDSWKFAKPPYSLDDRPLSYFIAHEIIHKILMKNNGRFNFSTPSWIEEGYADFIAKGDQFNYLENLKLLKLHAPELDPSQGLYRNYHLHVYFLFKYQNYSILKLLTEKPDFDKVNKELLASDEK